MNYTIPILPLSIDLETKPILKKLAKTHQALAELKGVTGIIPNQSIIIDTLSVQEAKDSSAIENIITTHDELYTMEELQIHRNTSTKYLEELVRINLLSKHKIGKDNFYLNDSLFALLLNAGNKSDKIP